MRKAFTMIEIIFVIVIIGVLASIAIPKLSTSKDNARGSMCTHEIGQLIHEVSGMFHRKGYTNFSTLMISEMTNIKMSVGANGTGILEAPETTIDATGVTYICDGDAVVSLVGTRVVDGYILTLVDKNPTFPAASSSANQIRKLHGLVAGSSKLFKL